MYVYVRCVCVCQAFLANFVFDSRFASALPLRQLWSPRRSTAEQRRSGGAYAKRDSAKMSDVTKKVGAPTDTRTFLVVASVSNV